MSKRPLLYIHQNKEVDVEVKTQAFSYMKRVLNLNESDEIIDPKNEKQKKESNEKEVKTTVIKVEDEAHPTKEDEPSVQQLNDKKFNEMNVSERLLYIQSISKYFKPKIELKLKEVNYVGTLMEIKKGIVVLRTQTTPFVVEINIEEITSVKIKSF